MHYQYMGSKKYWISSKYWLSLLFFFLIIFPLFRGARLHLYKYKEHFLNHQWDDPCNWWGPKHLMSTMYVLRGNVKKTRARCTTGAQVEQVQTIWLSMACSILTYNLFHAQAWSCTNVHDLILYYFYLSVLKGSVHDCILHGCSSVCDCTECGCSVCIILDRTH